MIVNKNYILHLFMYFKLVCVLILLSHIISHRGKMGNVAMRVMWPLGVSHKL